jgi:Cu/Ag efflux protein CusF
MLAGRLGVMVAVASLSLAPVAWADGATPMPSGSVARTVTMQATVTGIDVPGRVVTLKGPKGNSVTFHVGDDVKNLDQVKVGDIVVAKYYESLALKVTKDGAPTGDAVTAAVSAPKGQMPAGAVVQSDTIKAKVTAIGKHKDWVTLVGPEGNALTIKVKDPKNLAGVKVGDDVSATYTQALAIAVEPVPPKGK